MYSFFLFQTSNNRFLDNGAMVICLKSRTNYDKYCKIHQHMCKRHPSIVYDKAINNPFTSKDCYTYLVKIQQGKKDKKIGNSGYPSGDPDSADEQPGKSSPSRNQ